MHLTGCLPLLPPPGEGQSRIECVVRLPDGARCSASLAATAPLKALFWMVDAAGSLGAADYALATTYPRRRFARPPDGSASGGEGATLLSEGLASESRVAFFVERV